MPADSSDRIALESDRVITAERAILGTFLIRPEQLKSKDTEGLTPDDFQLRGHQLLYQVMLMLGENDQCIPLEIEAELEKRGQLEAVGGVSYISALLDDSVFHPSLDPYVKVLKNATTRRGILAATELAQERAAAGLEASGIIDSAIASLETLREKSAVVDDVLVPWRRFSGHGLEQIDWLVDGIIEVGTNGFILGPPKSRKSWVAEALAVSLISGQSWFGQNVRRRRVALVSREDHSDTTARRVKQLMRGKDIDPESAWVSDQFWLNSRAESRLLLLTDSLALRSLISNLKSRRVEFLILDVLGVMHEGDENEVREMRAVLRCVERLAGEIGCQVCIVHHARKGCEWSDTLSNWARGSSVIAGFAEFLMGCMVEDEEQGIIHTKFDSKADVAIKPFYWKIESFPERKALELNRVEYEPPKRRGRENLF